jgi:hypothetical protein
MDAGGTRGLDGSGYGSAGGVTTALRAEVITGADLVDPRSEIDAWLLATSKILTIGVSFAF